MTAQVNSMKIDELIEYIDALDGYEMSEQEQIIYDIASFALKAHKAGYKMFTYDYSERDLVEAECELSKILEGLTNDRN